MSEKDWQHIWNVFEGALAREGEAERTRYVHDACSGDSRLQQEVLSLLEAHHVDGFLDEMGHVLRRPLTSAVGPDRQRMGPYQLLEEAGRGGMGVVFRARDERLHRDVAIKMLPAHLSADASAKTRFIAEARAAARLEHPNIATIYDIGEADDGRLYIAMAYYEGETLETRIARGPLKLETAVDFGIQIARGLERAHAEGIVHRDIKPANVLLTDNGGVKILDFGIAKVADLNLTRDGTTIGTVAYMSPEQSEGKAVDHRSDLWSLGVVLYEMVTGSRPFVGDYKDAVLYAIRHDDPANVRSLRPDVSTAVEKAIHRSLQRDPQARFATAGALIDALEIRSETPARSSRAWGSGSTTIKAAPERMRATVLVSQLIGFEHLVEQLVPEEVEEIAARIRGHVESIVVSYDGVLYQMDGESLVALFGIPTPHEDDFVRAVRAAKEMHACLRILSDEIERRVGQTLCPATGIDTGLVVVQASEDEGSYRVTGGALQLAAQLSAHADACEILLSPDSERLVRPFFEMETVVPTRLKGSDGTLTPYRVGCETGSETRMEAAEKAGLTIYSGRHHELEALGQALERSVGGDGQFVSVVGDAGMGKSRLLFEFQRALSNDIIVVKGRCQSHGGKTSYLPFIEMLRDYFGAEGEPSEEKIVRGIKAVDESLEVFLPLYLHILSIESRQYPDPEHLEGEDLRMATVEALCGVFTLSSRQRPLVMLLEDWHWADDASQDVLKQIAELTSSYPMLVIVTHRPEHRPNWTHSAHHTSIHLKPLDEDSSADIVRYVLEADDVADDLSRLLHTRTGGNPFFLEEVCRTLLEESLLQVEDGRAISMRSLEALHLPDTVQAVIRSRLHRLDHQDRKILRVASVIGRDFSKETLQEVLSEEENLLPSLSRLRELGLIQQIRVLPDAAYRFKHVLTQEVAYDSLLQHQRKSLHEKVGKDFEKLSDNAEEQLDLLVHHFAKAENWPKAARYGRLAAKRSIRLSQFVEAGAVLEDVHSWLQILPANADRREQLVDVLLEHERVCETIGDRGRQQQIIDELLTLLEHGDAAMLAEVHRRQGDLCVLRRQFEPAAAALEKALEIARSAGDQEVERRTLRSMGFLRWNEGNADEAIALNLELLNLHRSSGDDRAVAGDLVNLGIILREAGRYDEALNYVQQAQEVVDRTDNPSLTAYVYHSHGIIYQLTGDNEKGIAYLEKARTIVDTHRLPLQLSFNLMSLAHIYLKTGRIEESLERYRESIELTRRSRFAEGLAKSLRVLGDVLVNLNRYDEALQYLEESAEWFQRLEDAASEADALAKMASIYEEQRSVEKAEAVWHRMGELLERLDPLYELDAIEASARLARMRGNDAEALAHYMDALELAARIADDERQGRLRNNAGILEWQRGSFDDALDHYEKALELFRRAGDDVGIGLMMNSIGVTLHKIGRVDEAVRRLLDALQLHRETGQRQFEGHALAALGDAYMANRRPDEAMEVYAESLQIRWELNDRRGEGWMLHHLATAHAAREEYDRARDYAEQAAVIAQEVGEKKLLEACETLLGAKE